MSYSEARKKYSEKGIDTESAIENLKKVVLSLHVWQGDDVVGFDSRQSLSGGIQTTGNYPYRATTPEQLMDDMDFAFSRIPCRKKLNVHASYAIIEDGEKTDRDSIGPRNFRKWVEYAVERGWGLDFNPTFFSHPMVKDGLTLSSPDDKVRRFWIEHGKRCVEISEYFANETGIPCVMNIWIPDGFKDIPGDRIGPRRRFCESLDKIISSGYDREKVYITLESKVFGIGVESYTVGSAEFCTAYSMSRHITPLMDNGHYHPTEVVSDKISSMLLFNDKIALHLTRPVRWDSDHVVIFDDETREIAKEIVRCGIDRVFLATDFFDASVNRISAWITGGRAVMKALLYAMLENSRELKKAQDGFDMTSLMVMHEELKTLPFGDVWEEYLKRCGMKNDYLGEVREYEKKTAKERV